MPVPVLATDARRKPAAAAGFTPAAAACVALCLALAACGGSALPTTGDPQAPAGDANAGGSEPGAAGPAPAPSRRAAFTLPATPAAPLAAATGRTRHVSPSGDDAADGSEGAPLRTVGRAVSLADPGDVVLVHAGTYPESVVIDRPGHAGAWITLRAADGERALLKGVATGPGLWLRHDQCEAVLAGSDSGNDECRPLYWIVQGLELVPGDPSTGAVGVRVDTPRVRLRGLQLAGQAAAGVRVERTANDVEILDNVIWQDSAPAMPVADAAAIDVLGADRVLVAGNHVHDFAGTGIRTRANARETVIENNLLTAIGDAAAGDAIVIGKSLADQRLLDGSVQAYDAVVRNNVVVGSSGACVAVASSQGARVLHNSCHDTAQRAGAALAVVRDGVPGADVDLRANVLSGVAARLLLLLAPDALADEATLRIDGNLYWADAAEPQFASPGRFGPVGLDEWRNRYRALSGREDSSLQAAPQFESTAGADALSPAATSPAIDAVVPDLRLAAIDRAGRTRPQGANADIGAWERAGGSSAFTFLAYGDSRGGGGCSANTRHLALVNRMVGEPAAMVFHLGDMVTGFDASTNWVNRGNCPLDASRGSLKEIIAPLQARAPTAGLPTFFFPVVGNHDESWGSNWYPDRFGDGFCDVFDPVPLVPNHTRSSTFLDRTARARHLTDPEFAQLACSKSDATVYPTYFYYSFEHRNVHFVILRVNGDGYDLLGCAGSDCSDPSDYAQARERHQLDWLQADLAKAAVRPSIRHIVVLLHAPVLTGSTGHNANASSAVLTRLFTRYGVKLVLQGHNHVYERSHPARFDTLAAGGTRDDAGGTVYSTTGGGGSSLHGFNGPHPLMAVQSADYHYLRVRVDDDGLAVEAVRPNGTLLDSYRR